MGKLIWLPLIAFYLNTTEVNKKPEGYPFVPLEMAQLAVSKGYPLVDAVLGKFQQEFNQTNYVILSYQELIDWFRDEKHIHITISMDNFSGRRSKRIEYMYTIKSTITGETLEGKWFTFDNFYEAQHNAIMDAFKFITDEQHNTTR